MSRTIQVAEVIAFFRTAFSLVLALALAEAFKQFVNDRANERKDTVVYWDRLVTLLSFLLLIFPFYQGTFRYFVFTYGDANAVPDYYSAYIMFDSIAFLAEAALFFIMSRALSPSHWDTYYGSVLVLLFLDSFWGLMAAKFHHTPIEAWIYLNIGFGVIVGVMLLARKKLSNEIATAAGFTAVLIRTGLDYYLSWNFYFP
jgi:hypothetical protein